MKKLQHIIDQLIKLNIHIHVQGNDLKISGSQENITPEIIQLIREHKAGLLEFLQSINKQSDAGISPAAFQEDYPLSSSQHRLWVLSQFPEGSVAYNMPGVYQFEGNLDIDALTNAFNRLIDRHESLRTVFVQNEQGEPRQRILPADKTTAFAINTLDLRSTPQLVDQHIQQDFQQPFDLKNGPLLRAALYQTADDKWVFTYLMHHICSDGWSMDILIKELLLFYNSAVTGQQIELQPLAIQYKDYACWQQQQLSGDTLLQHRQYWMQQLQAPLPVLELPLDKQRPAIKTYNGNNVYKKLNTQVAEKLTNICRQQDATLFMGLLTGVTALLHRYSNQDDIIIGSPIAGREQTALAEQIGFYLNTLALRLQPGENTSFAALLQQAKQVTLQAYQHQVYPFDQLLDALELQRDMSRNPLFDVLIDYHHNKEKASTQRQLQGLKVSGYEADVHPVSKFDLTFMFIDNPEGLHLLIEYNTDLFEETTVHRMFTQLEELITAGISMPDRAIGQLSYIPEAAQQQLLKEFNTTPALYDGHIPVLTLFREQVEKQPQATAVIFENTALSYLQLDEASDRLASYIKTQYNIQPDQRIALMMDRSEKTLIAMLAVLKAGAAFVPVDPVYPPARKQYIIRDAEAVLLITQTDYIFDIDYYQGPVFAVDAQLDGLPEADKTILSIGSADDLAYVIYTSGSTGQPKGCAMTHANLSHYIQWANAYYFKNNEAPHFALFTSISFDLSITSIFCPLTAGGTITVYNQQLDVASVLQQCCDPRSGVNAIKVTPSHVNMIAQLNLTETAIHTAILGGEQVTTEQVRVLKSLNPQTKVYNEYGPTETTVGCIVKELDDHTPILIGKPIYGIEIFILSPQGELCPIGIPGEICISGAGLARQYLNNPQLTAQKFVPNPLRPGQRMYKTGDLGRWLPDGQIQFIGRKDEQVKIRGYRIEPGEIENVLLTYPGISSVVVIPIGNKDGDKELAAYLVSEEQITIAELQSFLTAQLPAYMHPGYLIQLETLPLTHNGKVDKSKLPAPTSALETAYIAPVNETEQQFVNIWQEILGKENIGTAHSFFHLGGDSIKILRMLAAVKKATQLDISVADVYKHNTIADLLAHVQSGVPQRTQQQAERLQKETEVKATIQTLKEAVLQQIEDTSNIEDIYPMSDIEKGMVFESVLHRQQGMYHDQMVHQRSFPDFNPDRFQQALQLLADKHPILRTAFNITDFDRELQIVYKKIEAKLHYEDLTSLSRQTQESSIRGFLEEQMQQPFDTTQAPLWRMAAFRLGITEVVFVFQCHHAIIDGWSDALFMTELNNLYLQLATNPGFIPEKLNVSYKDFIIQHETDKADDNIKTFWKQDLADAVRLDIFTTESKLQLLHHRFDSTLMRQLEKTAATLGTSEKAIALSAYLYLLKVLNFDQQVMTGVVTHMRPNLPGSDQLLGCFLNTIPFYLAVDEPQTGAELAARVHEKMILLKDNERLSMFEIARLHNKEQAGNPFFDVLFDFVDFHVFDNIQETDQSSTLPSLNVVGGVDLTNTYLDFMINRTGGNYVLSLRLTRELKAGLQPADLVAMYTAILEHIVTTPSRPLHQAGYIPETQQQQLLQDFNTIPSLYNGYISVVDLFAEKVKHHADATAVVFENTSLSYRQLDEISNKLAAYLITQYNIQPDQRVALMMERSEKTIIAMLAVLKAGAAFVPVDPVYPPARKQYIIQDAAAALLITQTDYIFDIDYYQGPVFAVDAQLDGLPAADKTIFPIGGADNLAYVIYTSGSTGQPKGCAMTAANLSHYIQWANGYYFKNGQTPHFALFTSISFDLSITSIFCPLTSGGALTVYNQQLDMAAVLQQCCDPRSGVNAIKVTPSHVNMIAQLNLAETAIHTAILGGEQVTTEQVSILKSLNPGMQVYNEYGPTETTVGCIVKELDEHTPVLIGKPISETTIFILSSQGQLCPVGVPGEICISGAGLARHYLNNPQLTAQKFVPNPFRPGQRMYKTGDLGRWLPDGQIQFIGRKDEQVKIRGYRIEPGEIENVLLTYPGVNAAIVLPWTNHTGDKELVAYLATREQLATADIKTFLAAQLPAYMHPGYFLQLEALPLTHNGKVDKSRLPAPDATHERNVAYMAPTNEIEQQLVNIWQDVLGRENIGILDSFFDLGGHSLSAIRLVNQLQRAFKVKIDLKDIFARTTLQQQALLIAETDNIAINHIIPATVQADYPLSSSQHRLWVLSQFPESNIAYNMPGVYLFEGALNINILNSAFNNLIARHESLRTVFVQNEQGEPRQLILPVYKAGTFAVNVLNLSATPQLVDQHIQQDFQQPFNLKNGPLLRATLYQVADDKWVFTYLMHHICSDGWSMDILIRELLLFYNSAISGQQIELQPLNIQYKDYACWQQQQLSGESLLQHRQYWMQQLQAPLPALELPLDKQRPALKTYNGNSIIKPVTPKVAEALKSLCRQQDTTLFIGLLTGVTALLHRYSNQDDIIIGSPIAGREHADLAEQIGFYLNTLALRMQLEENTSFAELLQHAKQVTLQAYQHQVYPFDQLLDTLELQRDMSRSPLFDVLIDYHHNKEKTSTRQQLQGLKVSGYEAGVHPVSKFDLTFMFVDNTDGLHLLIEYNTDLFEETTVQRMFTQLEELMVAGIKTPDKAIAQLSFIPEAEQQLLLKDFNTTPALYEGHTDVLTLFREQVKQHPQDTAVVYESSALSYLQLDEASDRLASYIKIQYNIQPDQRIALMMDRSEKTIIAMLAVLKAGAAFVPVDPVYPPARKQYIIQDAAAVLLITQTDYIFDIDYYQGPMFAVDAQLDGLPEADKTILTIGDADNLAYVIYTSGSTGQPKGCAMTNANLSHYIQWANAYYFRNGQVSHFALFTSISFDLSITSIFCPLASGGTLTVYNQQLDVASVLQQCCDPRSGVNAIKVTPSHVNMIAQLNLTETAIHTAILGGEQVTTEQVRVLKSLNPQIKVYNEYGPTETTVGCIVKELDEHTSILIGKPIYGIEIFILSPRGELCPVGIPGEICISGAGLARQYLNNPQLTAQKFIPNPFRPGQRMYKTGDLGRWLPDGQIQFIGRKDEQVKIRGYRIEPSEIENVLLTYPGISSVVVIPINNKTGDKELAAYLVGEEPISIAELQSFLTAQLPAYMHPSYLIQLEALPLTHNGKVDKSKLPAPTSALETAYIAPVNETEQLFVNIWQEILGKENIGTGHSFFHLGGDSIKILRMLAAVKKVTQLDISVADVYNHNTIAELLAHVQSGAPQRTQQQAERLQKEAAVKATIQTLKETVLQQIEDADNIEDIYPMSDIEKGMVFESVLHKQQGMYHDQMLHQRSFTDFNPDRFQQALQLLTDKHPILRTAFNITDFDRELQIVYKKIEAALHYEDLTKQNRPTQESTIRDFLAEQMQQPFDTTIAPLWRMAAFKLGSAEVVFVFQCHHAIIDGWSDALFMTELNNLYLQLATDPGFIPDQLNISYKDFIIQHETDKTDDNIKTFWKQDLADAVRLDIFTTEDKLQLLHHHFDGGLMRQLEKTAATLGTSEKAIALSAYLYLLKVLNFDQQVLTGLVTHMRPNLPGSDQLLGCFLNTIPFYLTVDELQTGAELATRVYEKMILLKDNERLSMFEIARLHNKEQAGNPFFDVLFDFVDFHVFDNIEESGQPSGLPALDVTGGVDLTNTFLDFMINRTGGNYVLSLRLTRELKAGLQPEDLVEMYTAILKHIITTPTAPLHQANFIAAAQQQQLLTDFNAIPALYSGSTSILELFAEKVKQQPDTTAIIFENTSLSYQQLDDASDSLASHLITTYHVGPDQRVALMMDRSEKTIIAMLAVLKAGAAFVPVDPVYPPARKQYIIQDAEAVLLITQTDYIFDIDYYQGPVFAIDAQLDGLPAADKTSLSISGTDNLAYVIYTSGSTGLPKGCAMTNANLSHYIRWANAYYFKNNEVPHFALFTSISFDLSITSIFCPLIAGGTLTVYNQQLDMATVLQQCCDPHSGVNAIKVTPSHVNAIAQLNLNKTAISTAILGGEQVTTEQVRALKSLNPWMQVYNEYGPTETTVGCIVKELDEHTPILIGKPISGIEIFILSQQGQLCPAGIPGEICISGAGLARQYLNNPQLTAQKFVPNPFRPGQRMYKTGDLGRWLPDGQIQFIGRKDEQVKIRGYRIEPGEIENVLLAHPGVNAAIVLPWTNHTGDKELVAYLVGEQTIEVAALKTFLSVQLPAYMHPGYYLQLDTLPLTPNGKVDKARLPAPSEQTTGRAEYVAPTNDTEQQLVYIWQEVLGKEKIGIRDNFFDMGGHSLTAIRLITRIKKEFSIEINMKDVFADPTIEVLADLINNDLWLQDSMEENDDVYSEIKL
ncbi:non-ribosomal peptide synthetase [Chitinophaga flava]|uniref:Carrier domain-containing protein n=1 Tax=Chitinophaga flava TaxID=2259036 RepID=A0A365XWB0_9BACT|nr:non-ribosomal peptide synthetase [Chitinophaga flava]RBL90281.1 hypothetical protein DF182_27845 [Chitinophaga flava]